MSDQVSTIYVIVQGRGGYTPGLYGPFANRDDADTWVAFKVPAGFDYWIVNRPYAVSEQEMKHVRLDQDRANKKAEREDAMWALTATS